MALAHVRALDSLIHSPRKRLPGFLPLFFSPQNKNFISELGIFSGKPSSQD